MKKCSVAGTSLKNISLDGYLFEIRKKAFYNCSSLREIILPHTFYALENEAFVGCSNLESITFYMMNKMRTVNGRLLILPQLKDV